MKKLFLHQHHVDLGAKTGSFAGFEMPLTYMGVKAEHLCVREHVGVFDVSHMGKFMVSGRAVASFIIEKLAMSSGLHECGPMPKCKALLLLGFFGFGRRRKAIYIQMARRSPRAVYRFGE